MISRRTALPAVLLLALTAACGGDDSDAIAEDRPAYANQTGTEGAQKFAGYWVEQMNEATTSGETDELRSLGLKACETCSDFPQQLDDIYEAGATDKQVGMLLTVTIPPNTVYATEDAKPQEYPGGDQRFRMIVVREAQHWMIKELGPR